jgi:hypothetical protein
MDVISHALWSNLIFKEANTPDQVLAIALGTAPDLLAFGPMMAVQLIRKQRKQWKKVDESNYQEIASAIPNWVYRIYDVTHSIPVWLVGFLVWWFLAGRIPWPAFAWLIHILVDIPTHTIKFFPTPFLWPFSGYRFGGISWGERWFMRLNYASIAAMYIVIYLL